MRVRSKQLFCQHLLQVVSLVSICLVANGDDDDEDKVILVKDSKEFGIHGNILSVGSIGKLPEWDSYGYIMYCPCMGRFGNQAEQFLGSLAFAKLLNRTLVVPPWRQYRNVPYSDFFKLEELEKYHKVILMEDFIQYLAPKHWSPGKRHGYCQVLNDQGCQMKENNAGRRFWDGFDVDFDDDDVVYHLNTNVDILNKRYKDVIKEWHTLFPASNHPVLTFKGAPASFPVQQGNRQLHQYIKWSDNIMQEAHLHMNKLFHGEKYVGIHLRNGIDWEKGCVWGEGRANFMASSQCLSKGQLLTSVMCYPSTQTILETTKMVVMVIDAKHVYIATDHDPLKEDLENYLQPIGVNVHYLNPILPQIDLAILGQSDYFIGNCASSFSSFVKRERDTSGENKPTTYWGFELESMYYR
ncbi:GDP-fucose protein O-fucosyltransferase 1-like [Saccoglossus kowalevskii]|uniref:GDP-fucose protein O-fucosyltransferase 1 n=1 Tax=Saccoglossus kowalevskii TaxID=10224 RepID=A0ABM0GI71_SACKO|nr:PREDICTED: GDP-fucose protein O-fucosyltransferase 1-like [Saccoglossus kowalevskii]